MDIVKQLPFDVCENCGEFILDVKQQELFYGDGGHHLALTVRCKNAGKCQQLKRNLKKLETENAVVS